ncbi:MAG TPA: competence protein ComK [Bacilli bacterium]|nr:competence protein ComK [Bacilli bacterium]
MLEYEINEKTLALIPVDEAKTKIYEVDKNFIVNKPIMKIMEESCQYFGSSLSGRQKGTTNLIGVTHKSPIIVEESKEMIFFPTASPRRNKCSWISLKNIDSYYTKEAFSYIKFNNNLELKLNISYGIIDNQILRATRLESVLRKRKY